MTRFHSVFSPLFESSIHRLPTPMTFAILSALAEEQQGVANQLKNARTTRRGQRDFVQGQLDGLDVVLALSGIGKVAAAATTTALAEHFGIQHLILTGVAGGIGDHVQVGDIVVAQHFLQHDMDARPLFPRWQVPGYPQSHFSCDTTLVQALTHAALDCAKQAAQWQEPLLAQRTPAVHCGLIISGDQFMHSASTTSTLQMELAQADYAPLAVEMEGAAIAQVCADYGIAFAGIRTISDRADATAHVDFQAFVTHVASRYAQHIVDHVVRERQR